MSKHDFHYYLEDGLAGLIPVYTDDGANGTRFIFLNNESFDSQMRLATHVEQLAKTFQKDISLIRDLSYEITGQRTMVPLPISSELILVPFIFRQNIGKNDGRIGYFIFNTIKRVFKKDKVYLELKDGKEIPLQENLITARKHMLYAIQVEKHMSQNKVLFNRKYFSTNEVEESYNRPATHADISVIGNMLLKIMDKMGI